MGPGAVGELHTRRVDRGANSERLGRCCLVRPKTPTKTRCQVLRHAGRGDGLQLFVDVMKLGFREEDTVMVRKVGPAGYAYHEPPYTDAECWELYKTFGPPVMVLSTRPRTHATQPPAAEPQPKAKRGRSPKPRSAAPPSRGRSK